MPISNADQLEARIMELIAQKEFRAAFEVALFGDGAQLIGYRGELYRYLVKELGNEEWAKDVFSQTSQNIWKGLQTFAGKSSFRTWAYTILKNTLFRYWKEKAKKEFASIRIKPSGATSSFSQAGGIRHSISESKIPADAPSPSTILRKQDQKEKLAYLIRKLSSPDQNLMTMILERGLNPKEIADELSSLLGKPVTPSTVRKRYERALSRLKKLAEKEGYLWEQ